MFAVFRYTLFFISLAVMLATFGIAIIVFFPLLLVVLFAL